MSKDEFLRMLHSLPGWNEMIKKGTPGFVARYKDVEFNIFRDDATHFLEVKPCNSKQVAVIDEFNLLMESCRAEIKTELEQASAERLIRDDNEADPVN